MKYIGQKVKAFVTALDGTGAPLIIAGQRDADYTVTIDGIDVSSKDSEGFWNEIIAGMRNWTVSCSGAHVLGDESHDIIEDAVIHEEHSYDTGQLVVFLQTEGGQVRYGRTLVTSFGLTAPHTDLTTYTIDLEGNGPVTKAEDLPAAFDAVYGAGSFEPAIAKFKEERKKIAEVNKAKKGDK